MFHRLLCFIDCYAKDESLELYRYNIVSMVSMVSIGGIVGIVGPWGC